MSEHLKNKIFKTVLASSDRNLWERFIFNQSETSLRMLDDIISEYPFLIEKISQSLKKKTQILSKDGAQALNKYIENELTVLDDLTKNL